MAETEMRAPLAHTHSIQEERASYSRHSERVSRASSRQMKWTTDDHDEADATFAFGRPLTIALCLASALQSTHSVPPMDGATVTSRTELDQDILDLTLSSETSRSNAVH